MPPPAPCTFLCLHTHSTQEHLGNQLISWIRCLGGREDTKMYGARDTPGPVWEPLFCGITSKIHSFSSFCPLHMCMLFVYTSIYYIEYTVYYHMPLKVLNHTVEIWLLSICSCLLKYIPLTIYSIFTTYCNLFHFPKFPHELYVILTWRCLFCYLNE